MKIELHHVPIRELVNGYVNSGYDGVVGYHGLWLRWICTETVPTTTGFYRSATGGEFLCWRMRQRRWGLESGGGVLEALARWGFFRLTETRC